MNISCRIDLVVVLWALSAFALYAEEGDRVLEIDRLKNPNPEELLRKKRSNHPGPYRPMSPELSNIDPFSLEKLNKDDFSKMSLQDPLLKFAYADVFMHAMNNLRQMDAHREIALADMRRRGEAVSPMLLRLIEENQENRIEISILGRIEYLGTVHLDPYLEYARKLLRERTQTMSASTAEAASLLLARHGTREDAELLEWVLKERPYVNYSVSKSLKVLRERLNPLRAEVRPEPVDRPSSDAQSDVGSAEVSANHLPKDAIRSSRLRSWISGGLVLLVLLGLYRLMRKGLRKPGS